MSFLSAFSAVLLLVTLVCVSGFVREDEDVGKDMIQIVSEKGYLIETHYVTTSDGYILTMFRIPHGLSNSSAIGSPILLQHGLLDSSYTWVNNAADESLGYILADEGFDVWFGNNRGNRYGRNHTTLDPDDGTDAFWSFTWDEMAMIDAPTMIHYVLETTGYTSMSWVGHSEGTIQMFAAATSTDNGDEYLASAISSLNLFVALAPVAYVTELASKLLVLLAHTDLLDRFVKQGVYEFLPYGPLEKVAPELCQWNNLCDLGLMAIFGPSDELDSERLQVYVSETPAGTSTQNIDHWAQGILNPTFQKYNFGSDEENMAHYGVAEPPLYDLAKLNVRTALFSGSHDYLADPNDVQRLVQEAAPSTKIVFWDEQDGYAHMDFTWAPSASSRIYPEVIKQIRNYTPAAAPPPAP